MSFLGYSLRLTPGKGIDRPPERSRAVQVSFLDPCPNPSRLNGGTPKFNRRAREISRQVSGKPKQIRRAAVNSMFSKDDIIFSYTTKQAVEDGVLVKADLELSSGAAIKFPVYFTGTVWDKYVKIPDEFKGIQDFNGRLGDILFMFAFQAKKCSGPVLSFKFTCQVPKSMPWTQNEEKSGISFQHRDVRLKAVISVQDIDDPSPAIFIMLPWED